MFQFTECCAGILKRVISPCRLVDTRDQSRWRDSWELSDGASVSPSRKKASSRRVRFAAEADEAECTQPASRFPPPLRTVPAGAGPEGACLRRYWESRLQFYRALGNAYGSTVPTSSVDMGQSLGLRDLLEAEQLVFDLADVLTAPYVNHHIGADPAPPSRLLSCLLYTSPSPRDGLLCRMPSSA